MQNVKKTNNEFFRSLFSSKSCNGQVESTTDYPAGKVLSNGQKFNAQSLTRMKKVIIFSFFPPNFPLDAWKWSIDYPAKTFMTMADFFLSTVRKSKKELDNRFRRSLFSSKSSNGQVEKQYWPPSRKTFVIRPKTSGSIFDTDKQAQHFLLFFHQTFLWTRENEDLKASRKLFMAEDWSFFFCQVSASHEENIKFFKKKISSKWYFGQVEWSFDKTAEKNDKRPIFFVPCPKLIKTDFFQKSLFSQ